MRIEEEYLAEQARRFARYAVRRGAQGRAEVDLVALERVPAALRGRLLRDWFAELPGAVPLGITQIAAIERLAAGRAGTVRITVAGLDIEREYERLRLAMPNTQADAFAFAVPTEHASQVDGPHGRWRLTIDPHPSGHPRAAHSLYRDEWDVATAAFEGPLMLRPAAPGDTIVRSGRGAGKVRDIMVDLRVPRSARRDWPVLVDGARILWVPGVAIAAEAAAAVVVGDRVRFGWHRTR
jgi:tRNA(Ile)-lysidine synthetase-like protein